MMPYTYTADVEHSPTTLEYDTIKEAIYMALVDMDFGSAWPSHITSPDGFLLWEQCGPLKTSGSLNLFASLHGVQFP